MVDPTGILAFIGALTIGDAAIGAVTEPDEFECPSCGETYPSEKRRGDLCVTCNLKRTIGTE